MTVWEDVYTGFLLSYRIMGTDLAVVESGIGNGHAHPFYSDGYGMQLAPTTQVWHFDDSVLPSFVEYLPGEQSLHPPTLETPLADE